MTNPVTQNECCNPNHIISYRRFKSLIAIFRTHPLQQGGPLPSTAGMRNQMQFRKSRTQLNLLTFPTTDKEKISHGRQECCGYTYYWRHGFRQWRREHAVSKDAGWMDSFLCYTHINIWQYLELVLAQIWIKILYDLKWLVQRMGMLFCAYPHIILESCF
jgi:hypothetical protein